MSEIKVNKISPRTACGTVTLGDSGDTFTIPSGATITNAGTASGFGATGETSWDTTVKTSGFTATAGIGYFCNTTSGGFTVTLPAGTAGNSVAVVDYANTFDTAGLTVAPNGSEKINGGAAGGPISLTTEGQSLTLVYIDGTQGWRSIQDSTTSPEGSNFITATGGTITTSGDYKIHTFNSPGTFTVTGVAATPANSAVAYMVVGGGGGGGSGEAAGGAGAGGFREGRTNPVTPYTASPLAAACSGLTVTAQAYPITVGSGGAGGTESSPGIPGYQGTVGVNSVFSSITSTGGGGGGAGGTGTGGNGGSGGGGGAGQGGPGTLSGGSGNSPPVSPAQGKDGGDGGGPGNPVGAGGGGGSTACGADGSPSGGSSGGAGATTEINASPVARGGGGGGGIFTTPAVAPGGTGGGGAGSSAGGPAGAVAAVAGTVNTGGGGGGASGCNGTPRNVGASGGSGVVIIRYKYQ